MEVRSLIELQNALDASRDKEECSIWVLSSDSEFPCMNILIKGDMAYVHYFIKDRHPGYQSVGQSTEESMVTINEEDQIIVPIETLVTYNEAVTAAKEFLQNGALPTSIEWYEL